MRAVLPGKPRATLQALATAEWNEKRFVVYVSGSALVILDQPNHVYQTIYHDEVHTFESVAIDEETGKIAACTQSAAFVYKPYGYEDGLLKWSLQCFVDDICDSNTADSAPAISWGSSGELLVGSGALRLFQTAEDEGKLLWERQLSSPVIRAKFSGDASLIATHAQYDRLVKIWRRLAFGPADVQFDYGYLPHKSAVASLQWRIYPEKEHKTRQVLFTISTDKKIRIWAAVNPHGTQVLQLWREIDMESSIQPRDLERSSLSSIRHALFMGSRDFKTTVLNALTHNTNPLEKPILEHLIEISEQNPDICLVMDELGHMCAWGMQNIGSRDYQATDIFNLAHVEDFNLIGLAQTAAKFSARNIVGFPSGKEQCTYSILVHGHDGNIAWFEGPIEDYFEPTLKIPRLQSKAYWTGHEAPIKKIIRTMGGREIFSRTSDNEGYLWNQSDEPSGSTLLQRSFLPPTDYIHRACVLSRGSYVATLHESYVRLWDASASIAKSISSCSFKLKGRPLCLLQLPRPELASAVRYLATISSDMQGLVWRIDSSGDQGSGTATLREFCSFELKPHGNLSYVIPIDPAGSKPMVSGFLDTFAKDVALSYTEDGVLNTWTAKINPETASVDWLVTASITTCIPNPSLASGSSIRKIALVNSSRDSLTLWDSRTGQLEYETKFSPADSVQDLDWTSTPDDQSILAVGFPHKVTILAQIRYDYLDRKPAWLPIREISIRECTSHPIGDSVWLGNGNLVIGAGNQLFMFGKEIATSDDEMVSELSQPIHTQSSPNLFNVVSYLNGPLAIFHPQLLSQCILAGKLSLVEDIVVNLSKVLRFWSEGDPLDGALGMQFDGIFTENGEESVMTSRHQRRKSSLVNGFTDVEESSVTEVLAASLNENLKKKSIPYLSNNEQIHLADLVECLVTVEQQRRSMDENALRYLLFFRQHMLRKSESLSQSSNVSWREFAWAFHSGSQDILLDLISRHFSGKILWEQAKETGMFMWITDHNTLRGQFEAVARNEYAKTDERDPVHCSLYYLALKKKNVLMGLWRMAAWHKEQRGTQRLLANNFDEPRWKTAALKNAYALMGKRRFEYAAAWFLLAGNLRDAVSVCANQLQDLQLAVAIARIYGGDESQELYELLEQKVLPRAAAEGNRWMATWAFWLLGRRDSAVRALITPVDKLVDEAPAPSMEGLSYLATDPALVVLYRQLRDMSLQTLKGATKITPRAEWEFVIQIARLYDRMGCDLLALELVRNWEFLKQPSKPVTEANGVPDPRKLLRRRSSLVVDDLAPRSPTALRGPRTPGLKQPPPQVFEEPEANSLLDSFGF